MRSRFRPSHATVVAYVALFVALGGTAVAANGGNFILGQSNTAGNPTQLTSPTTNSAGALKVTSTASSGGRAIQGRSNTGQGVYGYSSQNAGVVGESLNLDGVYGVSNSATHAAVSAHNDVWGGFGLWAIGGDRANNTAAIHGQSAKGNAIEGYSTANPASGVFGQDNNVNSYGVAGHSDNGVAVVGDSSKGWAVQALGHATQSRTKSGFVKAMALVDPNGLDPVNQPLPIQRCFSSQRPIGTATSGNCGITYSRSQPGVYTLDFGFQVSDRFVSATPADAQGSSIVAVSPGSTSASAKVTFFNTGVRAYNDGPFYIFVY
jgi:hypothetical protein